MASKQTMFASLRHMAEEIGGAEKQAAAGRIKQGEGPTPSDPGGYQGATTHPTKSVGNNVQSVQTGARASENEKDVKADQGAPGVNSTPEASHKEGSGDQDSVQLNIGTTQSATGEDPSVEDDYKGTKDDPGTTHPAKTDDGEKYAAMKFPEIKGVADLLANSICADLANGYGTKLASLNPAAHGDRPVQQPKVVGHSEGTQPVKTAGANAPISEKIAAAAAAVSGAHQAPTEQTAQGYELAGMLGVKLAAAQQAVAECVYNSRKEANLDADLVGSYITSFRKKVAADADPSEGEDHSQPGDSSSGAGEGGGEGGGAKGGGEGGGAPPMGAGGGGGASLGDALGGGADPGGLMGGGAGAPGAGGGNEEQAIMQLISALDELGIPIEALAQAGAGGDAGAGGGAPGGDLGGMGGAMGGAPPMGGGAPPMGGGGGAPPMGGDPLGGAGGGAPPMSEGMKLASACVAFKRSGRYKFAAANPGTPERALRNQMRNYVNELINAA